MLTEENSDLGFLWEKAKDLFYSQMGGAIAGKLRDTSTLEDTMRALNTAQAKLSKEYGSHDAHIAGRTIEINLSRIMERLELLMQIGDQSMKFAPETVSLVWSAFRMIFTVRPLAMFWPSLTYDGVHARGFSKMRSFVYSLRMLCT